MAVLVCMSIENCAVIECDVFCFRCDSIEKLKCQLDYLRSLLSDPVAFKNIFRFAYEFAKVSCSNLSAAARSFISPL